MLTALAGAVVLGVLSTFYDFVWAHFEVRHKAINGLVHGMTLLSVAGLVLAWPQRRVAAGLAGGATAGLHRRGVVLRVLSPARVPVGDRRRLDAAVAALRRARGVARHAPMASGAVLARGLTAALLSGAAFYLVSGMWTDHSAPPNYLRNFASWTFAFFPGFAALLGHETLRRCHRDTEHRVTVPPAINASICFT